MWFDDPIGDTIVALPMLRHVVIALCMGAATVSTAAVVWEPARLTWKRVHQQRPHLRGGERRRQTKPRD